MTTPTTLSIAARIECPRCRGTGTLNMPHCGTCGAPWDPAGGCLCPHYAKDPDNVHQFYTCPRCGGAGVLEITLRIDVADLPASIASQLSNAITCAQKVM